MSTVLRSADLRSAKELHNNQYKVMKNAPMYTIKYFSPTWSLLTYRDPLIGISHDGDQHV